jgi:hypothetical protein
MLGWAQGTVGIREASQIRKIDETLPTGILRAFLCPFQCHTD